MGIPLMIQERDNVMIEHLKKELGIHKKIDVVRAGLALLEKEARRLKQIKYWTMILKILRVNVPMNDL